MNIDVEAVNRLLVRCREAVETRDFVSPTMDEITALSLLLCEHPAHPPKPEPTEALGSSVCPICGKDEPHGHDREQIETWVNGRLSAWGWKAHVYNDFTDQPYGWYYWPHHTGIITRFIVGRPDDISGYMPLYRYPSAPKPPAEWMGEAAKEIIEDLLDSEMQTWSVVGQTVIEIIQRHAPKVPEGFKLMPVPQEMTKTDIDGWRRNHELGKLLAAAPSEGK